MSLRHLPALERLVDELAKLPSLGRKSALRIACHLLKTRREDVDALGGAIGALRDSIRLCGVCFGFTEADPCPICTDPARDQRILCVVEEATDVLSLERGGTFRGRYHVLGGRLSPMRGMTPDKLRIGELCRRLGPKNAKQKGAIEEVILATSPTVDGEATARCVAEEIHARGLALRVTRIGVGLPMGGDLDYTDELTLAKALEGRREY